MATLPRFGLHQPSEFSEALKLMERYGPRAKPMAGGTDLLRKMRAGTIDIDHVISLNRIESIRSIKWDERTGLSIGAGARISQVNRHAKVQAHYPALAHACSVMSTNQIRNMATVIGNIVNGSPCADTACPLLCYDAVAVISGVDNERIIPIKDFFIGPSAVDLKAGELISAIQLPKPLPDISTLYLRHSARSKVDIACVSSAVSLKLSSDGRVDRVRLTLGAAAPTPLRLEKIEQWLEGKSLDEAILEQTVMESAGMARPIGDVRASYEYRMAMIPILLRRALMYCRTEQMKNAT